jgi:hypothetical protein
MKPKTLPIPPDKKEYEGKKLNCTLVPELHKRGWDFTHPGGKFPFEIPLLQYLDEHARGIPLENIKLVFQNPEYWYFMCTLEYPAKEAEYKKAQQKYQDELRKFCTETLKELDEEK